MRARFEQLLRLVEKKGFRFDSGSVERLCSKDCRRVRVSARPDASMVAAQAANPALPSRDPRRVGMWHMRQTRPLPTRVTAAFLAAITAFSCVPVQALAEAEDALAVQSQAESAVAVQSSVTFDDVTLQDSKGNDLTPRWPHRQGGREGQAGRNVLGR